MIYSIAIWLLTLLIKLWFDIRRWYGNKPNHHSLGAAIVFMALSACTYLQPHPVWFLSYWAIFDMLWGKLTRNGWLYIGTTARLDRIQRRYPALMWAKIISASASIVWYAITKAA